MPKLKKILAFLVISLIAVAQFTAFAPKAQACSCALMELPPEKMAEYAMQTYDAIFEAQSEGTADLPYETGSPYGSVTVFEVLKSWKGITNNKITIRTGSDSGDCGYSFQAGKQYLIYAELLGDGTVKTELTTNICSPTKKIEDASEEIKYLNELRDDSAPTPTDDPSMPRAAR